MVYSNVEELVGNTPLVRLEKLSRKLGLKTPVLAKLEMYNPAGSAKDRIARAMLDGAKECGKLRENSVVIAATSGNTGIALAAIGGARGYRVLLVMPENMSVERRRLMAAFGASLELTPAAKGMAGANERAKKLAEELPNACLLDQFGDPFNPAAHFSGTGPELYADTEGKIDIFVAGVGTGGTLTGVGRFLKSQKREVRIVAVEPAASPVLSGGKAGAHGLQGIGAGFVPKVLDLSLCNEIVPVTEEEAEEMCRLLAREEGVLAGISSGAAFAAAARIARREESAGKCIAALFADGGERYLAGGLFG